MRTGGLFPIVVAGLVAWGFYRLVAVKQWARAGAAVAAIAASALGFWLAVFASPPVDDGLAEGLPPAITICIVVAFPLAVVGVISAAEEHLPVRSGTLCWRPRNALEGSARRTGVLFGAAAIGAHFVSEFIPGS
jgi:hypothetical protein